MAVIKCKMCGGDLDISEGLSVCECEYCGTKQTVPTADNEKKLTLFGRANRLRLANEFDKAAGVYESIVADFPEEAEAYWGLVLCKYGIEYVDDLATGKKIPTCHRVSFDSVLKDLDFEQACENADPIARRQYREEAKQFEDIRRGIVEVSGKEAPYDIFICYKETAEDGNRTIDSVIAQDVYDALTDKGYRVFFSRISLEDKLGTEYEPYIFAALNSAKIMLAFGTDYEYYNAVWVKNEWSRFLKLMEKDKSKYLIPCYKNLDPYDMPDEFQRLQGQDMGKVGAIQDLLRGVEKIIPRKAGQQNSDAGQDANIANATTLLQRGNMALEDSDWDKADRFFERVLDSNPESAEAYVGKLLASMKIQRADDLFGCSTSFLQCKDYFRALQYASPELKPMLEEQANKYCELHYSNAKEQLRAVSVKNTLTMNYQHLSAALEQLRLLPQDYRDVETLTKDSEDRINKLATMRLEGLIATGDYHSVGLTSDGRVVAVGSNGVGQCDVIRWTDVAAIAAGSSFTVCLHTDGTVSAVGDNRNGQCDVDKWNNIKAIAAGNAHTVGLNENGTVVAVGDNQRGQCDVRKWDGIVAIEAGYDYTIGLHKDGGILAAGNNDYKQCNISGWSDLLMLSAGERHTVGLRSDGTVLAVGDNRAGQCNVENWDNIVSIAAGAFYTLGLRADGTVVATGSFSDSVISSNGLYDIHNWNDVVLIAAGRNHVLGLHSDGTLEAIGSNESGMCNVDGWKLFQSLHTLEQERGRAAEQAERRKKEYAIMLSTEWNALQNELASLKGILAGIRRKEIEARLGDIQKELSKLKYRI